MYEVEFKDKYPTRGNHEQLSSNDCFTVLKQKHELITYYDIQMILCFQEHWKPLKILTKQFIRVRVTFRSVQLTHLKIISKQIYFTAQKS